MTAGARAGLCAALLALGGRPAAGEPAVRVTLSVDPCVDAAPAEIERLFFLELGSSRSDAPAPAGISRRPSRGRLHGDARVGLVAAQQLGHGDAPQVSLVQALQYQLQRRRAGWAMVAGPVVSVVHPSAVVASGAVVGSGSFVAPLAVVHTDARVGRACIVNTGAVV